MILLGLVIPVANKIESELTIADNKLVILDRQLQLPKNRDRHSLEKLRAIAIIKPSVFSGVAESRYDF